MANVLNGLFGGGKPADPVQAQAGDADFADFAGAAEPAPVSFPPPAANPLTGGAGLPAQTARPYTKWYNVHERHSLSDFKAEGVIMLAMAVVLVFHVIGSRMNRNKAKKWIAANAAPLTSEFASVGFTGIPTIVASKSDDGLTQTVAESNLRTSDNILTERSLFEFATYATGRANVAFVDIKLSLAKRFNPLAVFAETVLGFFWESIPQPVDVCEATLYPFDGKEALTVPRLPGSGDSRVNKSSYDNFVWALVHKESMKQVRDERYDVSLTFTKDHPSLPSWLTVMSESAEITNVLLTPELVDAAKAAGDNFQYLIVTDQPREKPVTIDETVPRKRIYLKYTLPSDNNYATLVPVFRHFLTLADLLAQSAHFRAEVLRKVKAIREEAIKQIKKAEEDEKNEERILERERAKKAKRDAELKALDAKAQKKYLDKEREKEIRKNTKKSTTRG
ncbi:DUF1682-domain-containing protein [Podospora conica]|nr:DUF1682-domain-containing protein [Schizothecium conicum]